MVENTACVQVPVDLPRRHGLRPLSTITDEGEQADEVRDRFVSLLSTEIPLCFRLAIIMRRTECEMNRNVGESQPLIRF
jgi:hypothetical protein